MPNYSLKIISDGTAESLHTWAIFRADEGYPVEKSREYYRTKLLAKMAGGKIMRRLEYQSDEAMRKAKR